MKAYENIGISVGIGLLAYLLTDKKEEALKNAAIVFGTSATLLSPITEDEDTIIYRLKKGKQHIYTGITYYVRKEKRINEHKKSGKDFDEARFGTKLYTRSEALEIEKKEILRKAKNVTLINKQHNPYKI